MSRKTCRACGEPLDGDSRKLYCNDACRQRFKKRFQEEQQNLPGKKTKRGTPEAEVISIPDYIQKAKDLVATQVLDDEIREVMREEVRKTISQQIADRVLGIADVMVNMLPDVAARLYTDLNSKDHTRAARAYTLLLRYFMPLADESRGGPGNVTVVNTVPGATVFEQKFGESVEAYEAGEVEPFEAGWDECYRCQQRHHPDNLREHDTTPAGTVRYICTSCRARNTLELLPGLG